MFVRGVGIVAATLAVSMALAAPSEVSEQVPRISVTAAVRPPNAPNAALISDTATDAIPPSCDRPGFSVANRSKDEGVYLFRTAAVRLRIAADRSVSIALRRAAIRRVSTTPVLSRVNMETLDPEPLHLECIDRRLQRSSDAEAEEGVEVVEIGPGHAIVPIDGRLNALFASPPIESEESVDAKPTLTLFAGESVDQELMISLLGDLNDRRVDRAMFVEQLVIELEVDLHDTRSGTDTTEVVQTAPIEVAILLPEGSV